MSGHIIDFPSARVARIARKGQRRLGDGTAKLPHQRLPAKPAKPAKPKLTLRCRIFQETAKHLTLRAEALLDAGSPNEAAKVLLDALNAVNAVKRPHRKYEPMEVTTCRLGVRVLRGLCYASLHAGRTPHEMFYNYGLMKHIDDPAEAEALAGRFAIAEGHKEEAVTRLYRARNGFAKDRPRQAVLASLDLVGVLAHLRRLAEVRRVAGEAAEYLAEPPEELLALSDVDRLAGIAPRIKSAVFAVKYCIA